MNIRRKKEVQDYYSNIAKTSSSCCGPESSCCGTTNPPVEILLSPDYKGGEKDIKQAADLGLGCGTPIEFADLEPGMAVLDLGSGAGIDVFLSARVVGPAGHVIGLDMTDAMLERANANRTKLGFTNVEFRKGEIEAMPVAANTIDRVLSNCVINLVPDKQKAFAEIHRVLKAGGRFIVSDTVSDVTIPESFREDADLWASCISGALPKDDYLAIIEKAGFFDVRVLSEKSYPLPAQYPFRILSVTVTGTK